LPLPSFPQATTTTAFVLSTKRRFSSTRYAFFVLAVVVEAVTHPSMGGCTLFQLTILFPIFDNLLEDMHSVKFALSDIQPAGSSTCPRHAHDINRSIGSSTSAIFVSLNCN